MKDFFKHNGILILVIAALLALIAFLASFLLGVMVVGGPLGCV